LIGIRFISAECFAIFLTPISCNYSWLGQKCQGAK